MFFELIDFIFSNTMAIITFVLTIGIIVIILIENRNPLKASAWVLIVGLIPIVGILVYIMFGQDQRRKHRISKRFYDRLMSKPRSLSIPKKFIKNRSSLKEYQNIINLIGSNEKAPLLEACDIKTFIWGKDMFSSMFEDIRLAKKTIHIQSYIFEDDKLFEELTNILIDKSKEGVRVRIIYDYVGSYSVPNKKWKKLKGYGIEVYPFMKVYIPILSSSINYRNHKKITIIDGAIGYVGGMNFASRYMGKTDKGVWRDTHFRLEGSIVAALQCSFLIDWYTVSRKILNYEKCFISSKDNKYHNESNIPMQLVSGGPITEFRDIEQSIISIIMRANKSILIETPYLLPTDNLNDAIIIASLSGVNVEIIIPDKGDSIVTSWAIDSYLSPLLKAGVKIYRYSEGFIHSKTMVVDGNISVIGSANMDFRSFEHNFEVIGIVYDDKFAKNLIEIFGNDKKSSQNMDINIWHKRNSYIRLRDGVMRLFSPLL